MDQRTYRELEAIYKRIYKLESALKTLDYTQHEESNSKIDYLAMMADIDIDEGEEEPDFGPEPEPVEEE